MKKRIYVKRSFWFSVKRLFLFALGLPLLWLISKIWCRWRVKGQVNLRSLNRKGCVVVVNHCHAMDSVITMLGLLPRYARITTIAANSELKVVGKIMRNAGCVPIPTDFRGLKQMTDEVIDEAQKGGTVIFFPEGHLIKDCAELREFKNGAFKVAQRAGVPVVPAAISYTADKRGKRLRYTLNIGEPIESKDRPRAYL